MIGSLVTACALGLTAAEAARAAVPEVRVLDGPEAQAMLDGLKRVGCPARRIARLDRAALAPPCVLVLCGKAPPAGAAEAKLVRAFLEGGGAVLGVGGGATWIIDHKLFDAKGYYLSGTTIHMSGFHGYHRLTFGYPGAKPEEDGMNGIPMLLRATAGPLMELGPRPSSILGAGGPYSLAALERVGKGLVLLIGADPQGGNAYHSLDKPTPTPGDKLKTDRLLANAIAFLQDPGANLIPNSGFEENTNLPPPQSNWQIDVRQGATSTWCTQDAPEGRVFLRIVCPARSSGSVRPFCPIVVERGSTCRLACLYRATAPWTLEVRFFHGPPDALKPQNAPAIRVPESKSWKREETLLVIPGDVAYVGLAATLLGPGELSLDEFTLRHDGQANHARSHGLRGNAGVGRSASAASNLGIQSVLHSGDAERRTTLVPTQSVGTRPTRPTCRRSPWNEGLF